MKTRLRMAEKLYKVETDPLLRSYLFGYIQGIRRSIYGEEYGTKEEHDIFHSIPEDDSDPQRREIGRGYRDGLTGKTPTGVL